MNQSGRTRSERVTPRISHRPFKSPSASSTSARRAELGTVLRALRGSTTANVGATRVSSGGTVSPGRTCRRSQVSRTTSSRARHMTSCGDIFAIRRRHHSRLGDVTAAPAVRSRHSVRPRLLPWSSLRARRAVSASAGRTARHRESSRAGHAGPCRSSALVSYGGGALTTPSAP